MARSEPLIIKLDTAPASDGWGFVGRVMVGNREAYRTLRAFTTPTEAETATQELVSHVLGAIMAGEEWRSLSRETHHAAQRADLNFGLQSAPAADQTSVTVDGESPDAMDSMR
jgi:hypothetical protein